MARQIELGFLRFWRELAEYQVNGGYPAPTMGEALRAWRAYDAAQKWREANPEIVALWRDAMTTTPEPWQPGRINPNRYRKD